MIQRLKNVWLFNVRADVLAGLTATLALIPDSIAFSFIAGVNPMVGVYASVCMLIVLSIFGARPAMLSAAAGSMAVLMTSLVANHGVEYLFAATVLTGILQWLMGILKMGRWMNYVPHAVVTGFINALAILILIAQFKYLKGESWWMGLIIVVTLAIIYLWPKVIKAIPSPLIAVTAVTLLTLTIGGGTTTVGDIAPLTAAWPTFHVPMVAFSLETLLIILPYSLSLAIVGYFETLLTQNLIDERTETVTDKEKEMKGQGFANFISGWFGGMAGCALVAESVINTKLGGRGRLSNLAAGIGLLLLIVTFGNVVALIPMAALIAVMLMVCYEIFDWKYVGAMRRMPKSDSLIMIATAAISVITRDLAKGVAVGVAIHVVVRLYRSRKRLNMGN
ncbi:SulP family inorganic anion transporter [Paenibacillus sp. HWE-109]|uniref:SulP family inorganic anion transporter n=1 Tax=Paenibacillus sp. HWE-109 TaxID=1306526 RepID=UPI001EDDD576|nr:SulP family inorganic anion transporter [Paenibacillus sp. HWE-109]UKS30881.1 SulP family inorganic anion transporter [Paenibacillus sp. HWE-109]